MTTTTDNTCNDNIKQVIKKAIEDYNQETGGNNIALLQGDNSLFDNNCLADSIFPYQHDEFVMTVKDEADIIIVVMNREANEQVLYGLGLIRGLELNKYYKNKYILLIIERGYTLPFVLTSEIKTISYDPNDFKRFDIMNDLSQKIVNKLRENKNYNQNYTGKRSKTQIPLENDGVKNRDKNYIYLVYDSNNESIKEYVNKIKVFLDKKENIKYFDKHHIKLGKNKKKENEDAKEMAGTYLFFISPELPNYAEKEGIDLDEMKISVKSAAF